MRKLIAALAAVSTIAGFSTPMPASASKILLDMSDMVLLSRGIADSEYDLTAIGYDGLHEPGSVVMTLFVYRGGSRFEEIDAVLVCREDFAIGSISDFMEGGFSK